MVNSKRKAVFLDRDNTLIEDPGYISHPSQVKLLPGTAASVTQLRKMDFLVIVVSNQSGVARGIVTEEVLAQIHHQLEKVLADEGAFLDAIYYCPYHPDGVIEKYRRESELRKPAPGMLLKAAEEMNIDLSGSWMIGDSYRDIEAGKRAGCKTILINNPIKPVVKNPSDSDPDRQAVNIREAVNIIRMYELRQTMETTLEQKRHEQTETHPAAESPAPAEKESIASAAAANAQTHKTPDVQKSEEVEDIKNKMKPADQTFTPLTVNAVTKTKPALPAETPIDKSYTDKKEIIGQAPQQTAESKKPAESIKTQISISKHPEEVHLPSRTEKLLEELLSHLKSTHRSRQYEDFTISKVAAGAAQFLAIACLAVSLWPIIDSTRSSDWILIMLGYAAVLQLMAIAFYIMRER